MATSPKLGSLIAGFWLTFMGLYFSLGIFLPGRRGRWGRRGEGARLSVFSQLLWAVFFTLFGIAAIASAYHRPWPERVFPFVILPLFATMIIMAWHDNRNKNIDEEKVG